MCPQCGQRFRHEKSFDVHKRKHNDTNVTCNEVENNTETSTLATAEFSQVVTEDMPACAIELLDLSDGVWQPSLSSETTLTVLCNRHFIDFRFSQKIT